MESKEISEDTCCSEKTIQKEAQKDLKASSLLFEIEAFPGTVSHIFRMNIPPLIVVREKHFSYYDKPPLIVKDYHLLFEVFLI